MTNVRVGLVFKVACIALVGVSSLLFQVSASSAQETPTEDSDSPATPAADEPTKDQAKEQAQEPAQDQATDNTPTPIDVSRAESVDARTARAPTRPLPTPPRRKTVPTKPAVTRGANEVVIRLMVEPPGIARVYWGVKDVGVAPLDLVRPRDSGPMDLIVRAPGYLNFHTRAYTDRDDKISIRLVLQAETPRTMGSHATEARASKSGSTQPSARDPKGKLQKKK